MMKRTLVSAVAMTIMAVLPEESAAQRGTGGLVVAGPDIRVEARFGRGYRDDGRLRWDRSRWLDRTPRRLVRGRHRWQRRAAFRQLVREHDRLHEELHYLRPHVSRGIHRSWHRAVGLGHHQFPRLGRGHRRFERDVPVGDPDEFDGRRGRRDGRGRP